jgi:nucleoside transporter
MSTAAAESTPSSVRSRLAVMMFLQYFVQGAYLSIVADYLRTYLQASGDEISWFMAALGAGPLLAPFIIGQLVDRHMATERVLAACHFLSGVLMIALYFQTTYLPVLILGTAYSVLYTPTMMLTNSLTFHHLASRDREFPLIRVWGTIGFIVPAWFILFYFLKGLSGDALSHAQGVAFLVSGAVGIVMGIYSLTLPNTPPEPRKSNFAPAVVLGLWKRRDFRVLFIVTFFLAAVHTYFFFFNSSLVRAVLARAGYEDWTQSFTTLGQIAEIGVMALLGPSIVRLGYKRTMLIGAAAYTVRCVVLALAADPAMPFSAAVSLAGLGQALHGVCFGFFLAAAFIFVDRTSPADVKGSMQTIFGTLIFGLGAVLGSFMGGRLETVYVDKSAAVAVYQWGPIWLWCAALGGVCFTVLATAFPATPTEHSTAPTEKSE